MQKTNGIYAALSWPPVYNIIQKIFGAKKERLSIAHKYIRAQEKNVILDIGCGTAQILDYLPDVQYFGFDINEQYIKSAKRNYKNKGQFFCEEFTQRHCTQLPKADIVLALGLLHHLDDTHAQELFRLAALSLKAGGRCITYDGCYVKGQNFIARLFLNADRGKNIRSQSEYTILAAPFFQEIRGEIKHRHFLPYTACILECIK